MKKIACIFILSLCFGLNSTHSETVQIFPVQHTSQLNKSEKKCIQKVYSLSSSIIASNESDHNPFSKKTKKGKKGLISIFYSPTNQLNFKIISFEVELVYFPQVFYFFRPHFTSGERGPPAILLP